MHLQINDSLQPVTSSHLVDTDADPVIPYDGWTVEEHRKSGMIDVTRLALFTHKEQTGNSFIKGNKLRDELVNVPVMNCRVLEHLLEHPELIPKYWKGKSIFFWGTVYRDSAGDLCVYCLDWDGQQWYVGCSWLCGQWSRYYPAAVSAS
jgi:hypothetical protein